MADEKQFADSYDIKKISAVGPGLISAQTGVLAHFAVYTGYFPSSAQCAHMADPRPLLDFHIEGPSEPEPLKCHNNDTDGSLDCSWTPVLQGEYTVYIMYNGENIRDSPFKVIVQGESIRAHSLTSRVRVLGSALKCCKAGQESKLTIDCGDKSIAAGLSAAMAGPKDAKANLELIEEADKAKFTLKFKPTAKGKYLLYVKIAGQNIPNSPFNIKVV